MRSRPFLLQCVEFCLKRWHCHHQTWKGAETKPLRYRLGSTPCVWVVFIILATCGKKLCLKWLPCVIQCPGSVFQMAGVRIVCGLDDWCPWWCSGLFLMQQVMKISQSCSGSVPVNVWWWFYSRAGSELPSRTLLRQMFRDPSQSVSSLWLYEGDSEGKDVGRTAEF